MKYLPGIKSFGLEGVDLNQYIESALEKMFTDNNENLKEYLLKIKDKLLFGELLSLD